MTGSFMVSSIISLIPSWQNGVIKDRQAGNSLLAVKNTLTSGT
jgi:hypothetical protein